MVETPLDHAETNKVRGSHQERQDKVGGGGSGKVLSFSDSTVLSRSLDELIQASFGSKFSFDIKEIDYRNKRGEILVSLYDLENYLREFVADSTLFSVTCSDVQRIFVSLGKYLLDLISEAEWISLSKGFSSVCLSAFKSIPADFRQIAIHGYLISMENDKERLLHRKFSDLYNLATNGIMQSHSGVEALNAMVKLLFQLPLDSESLPLYSHGICDTQNFYKCKLLAFKVLNMLIYPGELGADVSYNVDLESLKRLFSRFYRLANDVKCDRDILSNLGIALIGIVYIASKSNRTSLDVEPLFSEVTDVANLPMSTFEHGEFNDMEGMKAEELFSKDKLFSLFTALQPLSFVYSIRGIVKYLNHFYGENIFGTNKNMESVHAPLKILYSAYEIFKIAATEFVRVDVNYAALQGLQLFITFITADSFKVGALKTCLSTLPDIVLNFWSSRIRRSSHLSICIWKRFLEILHSIKNANLPFVDEYIDNMFDKSINYFGGNLKLKYFALQYLLRFSGPCEVLSKEPFIIPHLLCSLSNLSIKASSLSLLTELLLSIYRTFKSYDHKNGTDIAYITFKCFVYPVIIAILNLQKLQISGQDGSKLVPQKCTSHADLQVRADLLAESFKTIFSKIDKNCTLELLKLSACFSKSDFYPYLVEDEKRMLEHSGEYIISNRVNLEEFFKEMMFATRKKSVDAGDDRIVHLTGPLKFSESICLYNFRIIDRIEFVDLCTDDLKIKGILICSLSSPSKFLLENLKQGDCEGLFYISLDRFYAGLSHVNDGLRLNLFKTLVSLPKTTKRAHVLEIHLVLHACKGFMKTTLPSLRQNFVEALKPFITRLYTILASNIEKLQELMQTDHGKIKEYILYLDSDVDVRETDDIVFHFLFISILLERMVATIHPCSSDFKNTIALEIILMVYKIFCVTDSSLPSLIGLFDKEIILPLFYSLFYLSTKQQELIFQIMKFIPSFPAISYVQSSTDIDYIVTKSVSSLWSVRTLRYCSGSKALVLLINYALAGTLGDNFKRFTSLVFSDNVNTSAAYMDWLLRELDSYYHALCGGSANYSGAVSPVGVLSLISQFIDSVSGVLAKNLEVLQLSSTLFGKLEKISEYILRYVGNTISDNEQDIQIDCRGHLVVKDTDNLPQNINVAEEPTIDCKLCLSNLKCTIANCDLTPRFVDQDDFKTRPFTVMCWKTIHEVCNCLKSLLKLILSQISEGKNSDAGAGAKTLEVYKIIDKMGKFILLSLLRSRHLGCTDSFSEILTWFSKKLMACKLHNILNGWIDILLSLLKGEPINDHFDTDVPDLLRDSQRRSEPLALTFTSILRAETDRHQPILVPNVTKTLLELSGSDSIVTVSSYYSSLDVRIHALNILRAIYKCSELRAVNYLNCVATLNVSLKNMRHDNWSVRNSSALLFASVLQHITGHDINDTTSDTFTKIKDSMCSDVDFYEQINLVLDLLKQSNDSSFQESDTIFPISKYASIYQGSAFVLNLLTRIAICSFVTDEYGYLYDNVKFALTCDNACIRLMAANILSRNYFEISAVNLMNMILTTSFEMCKNVDDSNYVNGSLLLIQESMNIIIENDLGFMLLSLTKDGNVYANLRLVSDAVISNSFSFDTLQGMDYSSALICSLYLVCVTAKCFENFIQAIRTIEILCDSISGSETDFGSMEKSKLYVTNFSVILVLLSSGILGDGIFNLVLSTLHNELGSQVAGISLENKNLNSLKSLFPRIGEDDMPKIKCIGTLVNSFFTLFSLSSDTFPIISKEVTSGKRYDGFVDFICVLLGSDLNRNVLESMVQYIQNSQILEKLLLDSSFDSIYKLWITASSLLSSEDSDFNYIALLAIHNKVVIYMKKKGIYASKFFDKAWSKVVSTVVSKNVSNNFDLFLELFKTCHLYSLVNGTETRNYECNIFGVASGLVFRAVHPSSELLLRSHMSQFLCSIGVPLPVSDKDGGQNSKYVEEYNKYCLHLYASLLFLLHDDNNSVRMDAAICCSKAIDELGEGLHPLSCIPEWIYFVSRVFSLDKLLLFFDQFAFVDNTIYRPINYDIEQFARGMLAENGKITPTLSATSYKVDNANLFKLAEMDCIFHKEPYNMYMEYLVLMTSIDKVLCSLIKKEMYNEKEWRCKIGEFSANTAIKCQSILRNHVNENYKADVDLDLETIKHSISLDAIVVYCCVTGFSRSCISVLACQSNANPEIWKVLKMFGRISVSMNQLWCKHVQTILNKILKLEDTQCSCTSQIVNLLTNLEQLLDYF
ncbi:hypothetical protein BEWA_031020 [Theileria equi strain WA]|uniref:Uncharacterized protein n=1 Tax=Theileria equi strain WA TaxID=1537102 RepID=L0AZB4_THEEQ|nr:hypothetical protein BEWA_031020 [Theileria equi strain WA]AFZ80249.1 hypothetical protein BEWA_031020 [Theileria equi strain WA]|eukprot:XP_004829915.1 hypothetical protein BEWA_031020 [Theileria equi strain WA]